MSLYLDNAPTTVFQRPAEEVLPTRQQTPGRGRLLEPGRVLLKSRRNGWWLVLPIGVVAVLMLSLLFPGKTPEERGLAKARGDVALALQYLQEKTARAEQIAGFRLQEGLAELARQQQSGAKREGDAVPGAKPVEGEIQ
jgi:hypothetical protein